MAHPYAEHREHKVQRNRVASMTSGYVSGGHADAGADRKLVKSMVKPGSLKMEGKKSGGRLDQYARGGKVKKGATNVNVIVAPQGGGGAAPAMLPPPPMAGPPPMPPGLPPHPPMMPPGAPPPGMHRRGGRAYATGGKVADGPAWKEGLKNGTHVQHTDGKNDQSGLNRGKPITYAKGGPVEAFGMGPKMTAGSGVEQGREQKIALQKRSKRP